MDAQVELSICWAHMSEGMNSYVEDQMLNIGIKHGFSCINIRQVLWEVLKTEAEVFNTPRDLANVNALENHVRSLLLHKN